MDTNSLKALTTVFVIGFLSITITECDKNETERRKILYESDCGEVK